LAVSFNAGGSNGRNYLSGWADRNRDGDPFVFRFAVSLQMTVIEPVAEPRTIEPKWHLAWSPIVLGALTAAAVSSILIAFGTAIGLGVASAAPTWRDASVSLWLLSGIFLILAALASFGAGGYLAGRTRHPYDGVGAEDVERRDGWHGIASWALAVVLSAGLAGLVASSPISHPTALTSPPSSSEPPILSYEIDHLLRAQKRLPNAELEPVRAEAGRILLTSSSHSGVSADDRAFWWARSRHGPARNPAADIATGCRFPNGCGTPAATTAAGMHGSGPPPCREITSPAWRRKVREVNEPTGNPAPNRGTLIRP
jgi:hypothetical protein